MFDDDKNSDIHRSIGTQMEIINLMQVRDVKPYYYNLRPHFIFA